MSTSVYVARSLGVDSADIAPATVGTIVGGDTALDTHDGDTSYVVVRRGGVIIPIHEEMPFRWEHLSGPVPSPASVTSISLDVEYRKDDTHDGEGGALVTLGSRYEGVATSMSGAWGFATTTVYTTQTTTVDPFYTAHLTSGTVWWISPSSPGFIGTLAMRITYLRATIESAGTPHLRQRNRDTIRARNRASRQRGIRQRGYL